jgi:hypothetical protein
VDEVLDGEEEGSRASRDGVVRRVETRESRPAGETAELGDELVYSDAREVARLRHRSGEVLVGVRLGECVNRSVTEDGRCNRRPILGPDEVAEGREDEAVQLHAIILRGPA